jgi:hypothetical protein
MAPEDDDMDSNERIRLVSEIIRQAADLLSTTSATQRKRSRRAMVEVAMILAVELGDDVEAWLAEILDAKEYVDEIRKGRANR